LKNKQKDAEIYTANNYLDLIDHPVEMSDFTRFEFNARSALTNQTHKFRIPK
jgi:predicted metalloprotease with PDZ domain